MNVTPNTIEKDVKTFMKAGLVDQSYMDSDGEVNCTQMASDAANHFNLSTDEGALVWEWSFEMSQWWTSLGM